MTLIDFTWSQNNGIVVLRPTKVGRAASLVEEPTEVVGEADSRGWVFGDRRSGCPYYVGTANLGKLIISVLVQMGFVVFGGHQEFWVPCSNGPKLHKPDKPADWTDEAGFVMQRELPGYDELRALLG